MTDEERDKLLTDIAAITDKKSFAALLKEKAAALYQQIFNEGHASATGTLKGAKDSAETRATEAEEKLSTLQGEFDTFKASKPDVAAVEKEWRDKLKALEKRFTDYKEQVKAEGIATRVNGAVDKVRSLLKATIDDDKADALVDKKSVRDRIQSEDGKALKVFQPDLQIPYAGDDDAQLKALAEELAKGVDAKFVKSDVESGTGNRSSVPGGGNKKGKARFDQIRESVKKKTGDKDAPSQDEKLTKAFGVS